jgi:hypothetical protein
MSVTDHKLNKIMSISKPKLLAHKERSQMGTGGRSNSKVKEVGTCSVSTGSAVK